MNTGLPFSAILDAVDRRLDTGFDTEANTGVLSVADRQLAEGEQVLETYLRGQGREPTHDLHEGFRLLALHRQAARGDSGFNACRETCRELVFLRNSLAMDQGDAVETARILRMQSMVLRHLALFVGGRMVEAGLGEFCCSSRPLRQSGAAAPVLSRPDAPKPPSPALGDL